MFLVGGVFLNVLSLVFVVIVLVVMLALALAISVIMSRQRDDLRAQQRLLAALGDYAAVHEQDERRNRYAIKSLAGALELHDAVADLDEPPEFLTPPLSGELDISNALALAADAIRRRATNGGLRVAKEQIA